MRSYREIKADINIAKSKNDFNKIKMLIEELKEFKKISRRLVNYAIS